ncbi:peptidase C45 [Aquimarina sp. U1-2]|uniref:C45 family autoproteolytic acyltransferase/hydolase n=1 Tax=Aquimarina sp. U1-2 TaxID=2823141 RepID=UPI001AECC99C|nr:C45 family peptidase [Aquimarina sp. U1-2]MBP2832911.1 peptidase C45 [Aquimarina sp. U1-2]
MYHPRLYGSFYEMGLKYGSLLKDKVNFKLPRVSQHMKAFGLSCIPELRAFYPEIYDEITGFAEGIKDKPENVATFLLSLVPFASTAQCSVFAFRNNDSTIVGRNYDMSFAFKKFTESSLIAPDKKYSYVSQSDVFIGRSDGINEKGLFVAMSFVNGKKIQPGISFHFIVRRLLEEAATTSEAVYILKQAKVSSSNNFLIADNRGNINIVESTPDKSKVIELNGKDRFLHITNQFVSNEMCNHDNGGISWSKSTERYKSVASMLRNTSSLDLFKAKRILSDPCVCLNLKKEKFGTIWSIVANLNTLEIERAETKPKITNYKPETRLNWWLKKQKIIPSASGKI